MKALAARNEIQIFDRGSHLWTTSLDVAEKFGKRHSDVIRAIELLGSSEEFNERNFSLVTYQDSKNETRPMYEMTRDGFTILAMGFTGKKAMAWKEKYIQAFNAMERQLLQQARAAERRASLEYQQARMEGKVTRKAETDAIKAFVEHAKSQGSKNAQWYYKLLTQATYKALGLLEKGMPDEPIRELLNHIGLTHLSTAEYMVQETLLNGVQDGAYYKDIFTMCKVRLEAFASVVGRRQLTA